MADCVNFRCLGFLLFLYGVFLLLGLGSLLNGSDLFLGFSPLSQTLTRRGPRQPNLIIRLGATNDKGSYESGNSHSKSGSNFVPPERNMKTGYSALLEADSRRQPNGNQEGHTGTPLMVEKNVGEMRGEEKGATRPAGSTSNKTLPIQAKPEEKTAIETADRVATNVAEKKPEEKPAIKSAATTKDVEKKPEDKLATEKATTRTNVEKKHEDKLVINVAATNENEEKTSSARSISDGGQARPDFEGVYNNSVYLYAAHYNAITPPMVTIVAVVNRSAVAVVRTAVCLIFPNGYADNDNGGIKVTAWLNLLPDHHYTEFAAAHIRCSLPDSVTLTSLSSVTIHLTPEPHGYVNTSIGAAGPFSNGNTRTSSYGIRPMPVLMPLPRNYTFLICFSPLHRNFGDTTQVIANLELAQVMGAQHAVVYNTSVTKAVSRVLQHYQQKGFLEVLGWRDVPEPVHYKAQMGAINDCLIRNRLRSQYLVYMDFDEMIVPRKHESWSALLDALRAGSSSSDDFVRTGGSVVEMTKLFDARILREASSFTAASESESESARAANRMQLLPAVTGVSTQTESRLHPSTATSWKLSNSFGNDSFEIGAVSFPARVFLWDKVTNLSREEHVFANSLHLSYLLKQKHTLQLWPLRSKTIVNPRTIQMMGIHRVVWFLDSQHRTLLVNDTVALLQHYRWFSPSVPCAKDVSVLRFASELVRRMKKTVQELGTLR